MARYYWPDFSNQNRQSTQAGGRNEILATAIQFAFVQENFWWKIRWCTCRSFLDIAGAVVAQVLVPLIFWMKNKQTFLPTAYMPIGIGAPQWWHRGITIGLGDGIRPVCRHPFNRGKAGGNFTQWAFASSFARNCAHGSAWNRVGGGQQGRLQHLPPTLPCHGGWLFPPQSHADSDMPRPSNVIASVFMTTSPAWICRGAANVKMRNKPTGSR